MNMTNTSSMLLEMSIKELHFPLKYALFAEKLKLSLDLISLLDLVPMLLDMNSHVD
jgi:hypothetical protein